MSESRSSNTRASLSEIEPPSKLPSFVNVSEVCTVSELNEPLIRDHDKSNEIVQDTSIANDHNSMNIMNPIQVNLTPDANNPGVLIPVIQGDLNNAHNDFYQSKFSAAIPQNRGISVDNNDSLEKKETENNTWAGQSIIGWVKETVSTNPILSKVAEKARSSVDTVLTTLDPQMKDIIYSGEELEIYVTSYNEIKVSAVREAFQSVFGKATISATQTEQVKLAPQLVGFAAAFKAAKEKIDSVLHGNRLRKPVIAVENFLLELEHDKWFELSFIQLYDVSNNINLEIFTQAVSIPLEIITHLRAETSPDYELKATGFSTTIGNVLNQNFGTVNDDWYQVVSGLSQREVLINAAKSIARIYKKKLNFK